LQKSVKLPTTELKKIISIILKSLRAEKAVIGVSLVDDKTIRELNKKYRKKNKPTDVLSFAFEKEVGARCNVPLQNNLIGDVIISVETTIIQAKDYKHSFEKEFKILLIHGVLHLLGYDHIKEEDFVIMKKKEKEVFILLEGLHLKVKFK
jgi:rRNA maturation RNase YbeY